MSVPAISVLMPVYNAEKYVALAVESILSQSFNDFEFIIIDDASTDGSWKIISEYQKKDKRIKLFRNDANLGITKNRNKLINLAQGKYIVWQDADDISVSARLKKQYEFMENNPSVGISGGWLKFFTDLNGSIGVRKYHFDDAKLRKIIFKYSPVAQPAAIVRKEVFAKVGDYNENFTVAEDLEMSFRIGQYYKFANLNEVLIRYRQQSKSITFRKLKELEKNTLKIRFKFRRASEYNFSLSDWIYNLIQLLTLYIIPARLRVEIFNLFRNSR